jgi:hypothetical protein
MLEEHHVLLSLHETDIEVWETRLAEEQARGLHPFDVRDLLVKLEELHARVDGVDDEHTAEVEKLSILVVGISNALIHLTTLPIWDSP